VVLVEEEIGVEVAVLEVFALALDCLLFPEPRTQLLLLLVVLGLLMQQQQEQAVQTPYLALLLLTVAEVVEVLIIKMALLVVPVEVEKALSQARVQGALAILLQHLQHREAMVEVVIHLFQWLAAVVVEALDFLVKMHHQLLAEMVVMVLFLQFLALL
jgi:hypothetical protein